MPFIWNNNPNIPAANLPLPTGPTEISTEQRLVANTVNAGGALLYNTAAVGFDVVYELDSLNVDHLTANTLNVSGGGFRTAIGATTPINYDSNTGIISHAASGVTAGTYGDGTHIPIVQVDAKGHVTSVTNTIVVTPGSTQFPSWGPVNQQVGAGWAATQVALQTIIDNHRGGGLASAALQVHTLGQKATHANLYFIPSGTIANVNTGITIVAANTVGNTFTDQAGSVVLPDGRVYCLGTESKIYDPISDTISPAAGVFPSGYTATGVTWPGMTVLLNDGRVFCIPVNPTWIYTARVYDSKTDSLFTSVSSWFTLFASNAWGFAGGVLMPDGRVYCVPLTLGIGGANTQAKIYDAANDIVTTANGVYPYGGTQVGYRGAVLLPDGNVFVVPHEANTALIYNPVANTLTTANGTYKANVGSPAGFWGGVLLKDGRVFCVPYSSTTARIYDPVTNTLSTPTGTYPGNSSFAGGVLLPDGRVYMIPLVSTTARIYDPITDTLITPPGVVGGFGATGWVGGLLLPDGRVFWGPRNGNPAILISTGFERLPKAFVTSPFWNRT